MKETNKVKIRGILFNNYEFSECILEEVNWLYDGTCIELKVDYVWNDSNGFYIDSEGKHCVKKGSLRKDPDKSYIKILRFNLIQELLFKNFLHIKDKDEINEFGEGFNEIDIIRIEDNSYFLNYYRKEPIEYHHFYISFGGDRRLDIVCNEFEIIEKPFLRIINDTK